MEKDLKEIRVLVDAHLREQLFKHMNLGPYAKRTLSSIVREALDLYFQNIGKVKIISEVKPLEGMSNPKQPSDHGSFKVPGPFHLGARVTQPDPYSVILEERKKDREKRAKQLRDESLVSPSSDIPPVNE